MRRWLWVGFLLVAACSRTSLFDLTGATATGTGGTSGAGGGSGGTAASGGTAGSVATGGSAGTAGSGGSGGYVYATGSTCFGFIDRGPRAFAASGLMQTELKLVLSSADGQQVNLVYWSFGPPETDDELEQRPFKAWSDWPHTSLGQSVPLSPHTGHTFALAPAQSGHFAVASMWSRYGYGDVDGMIISTQATPGQELSNTQHLGVPHDAPLFLARGDMDHLLGFLRGKPGDFSAHFARVPGLQTPVLVHSGCATQEPRADAVRAGDHYIVALTSSRDVGACAPDGTGDGPPDRIEVVDLDDSNNVVQSQPEPPSQGVVTWLRLVPRSDGAWLVWQVSNMLMVGRLDQQGNLVTLPNAFASLPGSFFAVDRLGDDLALAYADGGPSNPRIRVQLFNKDSVGSPHVDFDLVLDPATEAPSGYLALLGAPSGHSLLVSWDTGAKKSIVTHRLDCVQTK